MKSPRVVTTRVFLSTRSAYSTSDTGTRYDAPSRSSSRSARTVPRGVHGPPQGGTQPLGHLGFQDKINVLHVVYRRGIVQKAADEDHLAAGQLLVQALGQLDAAAVGHTDIQQGDVGPVAPAGNGVHQLPGGGKRADVAVGGLRRLPGAVQGILHMQGFVVADGKTEHQASSVSP